MIELIYVFLIFLIALGAGRRLLRLLKCFPGELADELCFSLGIGLGALALSVMALGMAHLLYGWALYLLMVFWGIIGAKDLGGLGSLILQRVGGFRINWRGFSIYLVALLLIGIGFNIVRALSPVHGAVDPLAYHLALPKIYLAKHFLSFERTLTGSLYPANVEMLFGLGIGLRSGILAQLIHVGFGIASVLAVFSLGKKYFNRAVGLWAAAMFYFMPVMVFFAPLGYIDIGLCFFQILGIWALFNWLEQPNRQALLLAALLMGVALGTKHSAIVLGGTTGIAVAAFTWVRERKILWGAGRIALYFLVMGLVVSPWYIRSYIESGNPVWPQANDLFKGLPAKQREVVAQDVPPAGEQELESEDSWTLDTILKMPQYPFTFLWQWAFQNQGVQRATGIYFVAFLPGLLLYLRNRRVQLLTVFCFAYLIIVIFVVHGNPRYSLSLFGFMSVLAGYVAYGTSSRNRIFRYALNGAFACTLVFNLLWNYQLVKPGEWEVFLGKKTREYFLTQHEASYRVFGFINAQLPDSAVVLMQGMVRGYYCDRAYLWDHPYQAVLVYKQFNHPVELLNRLRALGITHIVRLLHMPAIRQGMYPEYFKDPMHANFTHTYLKPLYMDESFVLFEIRYDRG